MLILLCSGRVLFIYRTRTVLTFNYTGNMGIPIIYGNAIYCRKTVQPHEIGITPTESIKQFELIELYAHLYGIPVFSLGSSWIARGKNGKTHEVSEMHEWELKQMRYLWPSKLLAFTGPLLILAIIGLYIGWGVYKDHQYKIYEAAESLRIDNERIAYITHPAIDDYYDFEGNRSVNAIVTAYNDTAVQLCVLPLNPGRDAFTQVLTMLNGTTCTASGWISKQTLLGLTDENNRKVIPFLGAGVFNVNNITRLGDPILAYGGGGQSDTTYYVLVRNHGKSLIVTGIDKMQTNAVSKDSLPYFWTYMEYAQFIIKKDRGETFTFGFTCEDEKGKTFRYLVSGKQKRDAKIDVTRQP